MVGHALACPGQRLWSSCGHSLFHCVRAAAEFGGIIGGDFVEAIPGALKGGHIDGEQAARFGEGASLAAELDFVLVIGLAGMNSEELAARPITSTKSSSAARLA